MSQLNPEPPWSPARDLRDEVEKNGLCQTEMVVTEGFYGKAEIYKCPLPKNHGGQICVAMIGPGQRMVLGYRGISWEDWLRNSSLNRGPDDNS